MTRLARATIWPAPWSLLVGLCLITWLLGLALALPCGVERAITHWEGQINDHVMIALPPAGDTANTTSSGVEPLSRALADTFPGTDVTRLPERDVAQSLASWSAPWPGPLPSLVTLHYRGDMNTLGRLVHRYAQNAVIIPPPPQMAALTPLADTLRHAARNIARSAILAAGLLTLALLYLVGRNTALLNARQLTLLPRLGGSLSSLHRILARRVALLAFLGSLAGTVLLIPSLALITSTLRPLLRLPPFESMAAALYPDFFLPQALWGMFCLIPVLMAILGWGVSYLLSHIQGRHLQGRHGS